jgi:FMN phosphatase YigB (HAD superfamily)
MALTLEHYASYLDTRDLSWPAPPDVEVPRAKPHLVRLPGVRAVTWNVYGTLLRILGGELYFEHPQDFVMNVALDKTLQEFKMWGSMTRKPGQPSEYLRHIYEQVLLEQRAVTTSGEKHPEVSSEQIWESIIKKLLQKDYRWDTSFFGALNEFSRKVAYFFHASLQGSACHAGAAAALLHVKRRRLMQGLLADGQCFSAVQLQRGLEAQDARAQLDDLIPPGLRVLSYEVRARKPSERLFKHALALFAKKGITPEQVLHVGSRVQQDLVPARRLGMKTALFAGDKQSLQATPKQLQESASRPDVLVTELNQLAEVIG